MRKPVVGERLYAVFVNRFKEGKGRAKEVIVDKVGRKYFYVTGIGYDVRLKIDTWSEECEWDYRWEVWESREEYENYLQLQELLIEFKNRFDRWNKPNINLNQAIRIKKILEEKESLTNKSI